MKQKITFFTVLMIAMAISYNAKAYDFSAVAPTGQTLYYTICSNSHVELTAPGGNSGWYGYTKPTGSLVIPDTVTYNSITYTVVHISNGAFSYCENLTSVIIPNTVTLIGSNVFEMCYGLASVSIPNSVTELGGAIFYNCTNLVSVNIPDSCTMIAGYAFCGCTNLPSITIPATITSIGYFAFDGCSNLSEIYMKPCTPPSLSYNSLPSYPARIIVPCGCFDTYSSNSAWWGFFMGMTVYGVSINTGVNDVSMGITHEGVVNCDSTTIIWAEPFNGYAFDHWSNGSTANPDTLLLEGDTVVMAFFVPNEYTISTLSDNTEMGTVSGSISALYHDSVTLTAIANYGYHFSHWNDGDTTNPRRVLVSGYATYIAFFDYNQYNITLDVDDISHGYCYGGGPYSYLSECTINAIANYGYHFTQWSDGDTNNPRSFILTKDTSYTALFAKNQYTLTLLTSNDEYGSVSDGGTWEYLDTITIMASSEEHYHFVRWDDGNMDNPREYVIVGDVTLTAIFAMDTHHVSVAVNDFARGNVDGGGDFEYGQPCTVSATAYSGYQFVRWSNGVLYNPYTFAVLENVDLVAIFEPEGTEGISVVTENRNINAYSQDGHISIVGAEGCPITVYCTDGRILFSMNNSTQKVLVAVPVTGMYFVRVGDCQPQKMVVIR